MKLLFEVGPFSIHFFGIMIALGILVAYILLQREAARVGYSSDTLANVGIGVLLAGLVGARLGYALFYAPGLYLTNPLHLFAIHQGGLSIHGGIVGGLSAGWWMARKYKLSFWMLADLFAPPLILAQAIGRVGCDVFGKPMTTILPWAILYQGSLVHPAQLYEFLLNLGLFGWLWQRRKSQKVQGQLFFLYALGFLLIRGFVEFFRTNPVLFGFLSVSHLITIMGLILLLVVMFTVRRPRYESPQKAKFSLVSAVYIGVTALAGIALYYAVHLLF